MTEYITEWHWDEMRNAPNQDQREEIVRCRDCLKWDYDSPYPKKACFEFSNPEDGYIVMTSSDGFCAWPERRTE